MRSFKVIAPAEKLVELAPYKLPKVKTEMSRYCKYFNDSDICEIDIAAYYTNSGVSIVTVDIKYPSDVSLVPIVRTAMHKFKFTHLSTSFSGNAEYEALAGALRDLGFNIEGRHELYSSDKCAAYIALAQAAHNALCSKLI